MSESVSRRNNCRLCGGYDLEVVLELAPTPLADSYLSAEQLGKVQSTYPLDLFLCHNCGFSQLLDVVHPQVIYYDYIYETKSSLGLVEHFQGYANEVLNDIRPANGSLVVDIGSNDGTLLKFFQSGGMRVLGIDPAHEIASRATESGIETWPMFFTSELVRKIKNERGAATIITSNNLFANVDDLASMTEGIRELLAQDGVFVFESFYLADLMQNMVFDFIYHEHLSYFSVKPLDAFFRRYGMELIDAKRIPTKGGSLRYTVQLVDGPRNMSPSIAKLIDFESNLGLDRIETYQTFTKRINKVKNELLTLLSDLKAQGKTIIGYGASATSTTLIYHFGLRDMLSFIADDNPQRHNLFSPGHHIPVLSPQVIYEQKPDYILILAWRYYEPIVKKHPAYLEQGGHFIVPLPRVEVI